MSVRDVGQAGASWLPTLQQLLAGTCISAACPVAAGANYSEMEIDLQHLTKINPPSFWNYHYTDFLLKSNQSQWCTALSLESEGLPCIKSVRWWKGRGWLQRGTGSGGKKKKNLWEGFGMKLDVCAPREGTFRRSAQSPRKQMYSIWCAEIKVLEHLTAHLAILSCTFFSS